MTEKLKLPSQEYLLSLFIFDFSIGKMTWKNRPIEHFPNIKTWKVWNSKNAGNEAFTAKREDNYYVGSINSKMYRKSRILYKAYHGIEPEVVDHEDGNPLNNDITNLRNVSYQTNQKNQKLNKNNSSGHIGVRFTHRGKWQAYGIKNGRQLSIGTTDNYEEACKLRQDWQEKENYHESHGKRQ